MSNICKICKGSKFYVVSYFRFRKITEQKVLENNWFYFYSRSSYIYHINFILTNFLVFDEPPFFLGICVVHSWCWKSWIYHDLFWSNWGHLKSSPRGSCKMYRNIVSYCIGFVLHLGVIVWCLFWQTHEHPEIMFYVTAGLWGLCDSVWLTINSNKVCLPFSLFFPSLNFITIQWQVIYVIWILHFYYGI